MGIGPVLRWKNAKTLELATKLKWAFAISLVSAIIVPMVMGSWSVFVSIGLLLGFWIVVSGLVNLLEQIRRLRMGSERTIFQVINSLPRSYYGMLVAHFGVAVFIFGVTLVKGYEEERDVKLAVGESVELSGYRFSLTSLDDLIGPNYNGVKGTVFVHGDDGKLVSTLYPEKRFYHVQRMPMTEAAIDTGLFRDLYVSLGEALEDGSWVVRVYLKPFVDWIWGGAFLMALGGLLAISDKKYRSKRRSAPNQVAISS